MNSGNFVDCPALRGSPGIGCSFDEVPLREVEEMSASDDEERVVRGVKKLRTVRPDRLQIG